MLRCNESPQTVGEGGDVQVAENGCFAVGSLALNLDENRKELVLVGACEVVVNVLKKIGFELVQVAVQASIAIQNLANDDSIMEELVRHGAREATVETLQRFGEKCANIAEYGCGAIVVLARNGVTPKVLGRIGACEAAVKSLQSFGTENVKVAESGFSVIVVLASDNHSLLPKQLGQIGRMWRCGQCVEEVWHREHWSC